MISLAASIHQSGGISGTDGKIISAEDLRKRGAIQGLASSKVAVVLQEPLEMIRAVVALDGQVAAMLLLSGGIEKDTALALVERAGCGVILTDRNDLLELWNADRPSALLGASRREEVATEWLMTTSGTTGIPKIVPHNLQTLSRSVARLVNSEPPVWGLLYDPSRFAGMQVVLQALIGGGRLFAVDTHAPLGEQLGGLVTAGVSHLSATPTLWRRILMAPGHRNLPLRQATLGGEIADQSILSALSGTFPAARVTHIYASTEAGVGFSVTDRMEGFPESYLQAIPGGVQVKIVDDILWLRPPVPMLYRNMPGIEIDADGYVRSGDRVEHKGGRIRFLGRDSGLINIGGVKVHPERVEAVLASVPGVVMAQVSSKKSPLTGALVIAEIQATPDANREVLKSTILEACRSRLEREAVPAILRFVDGFETNAAGKLIRADKGS